GIRKLSARAWACDKRVGNTFERRVRRPQRGEYQDDTSTVGTARHQIKAKGSVERLGLLFYLLFVGERSPEWDKIVGNDFERRLRRPRRGEYQADTNTKSGTDLHSRRLPQGDGQDSPAYNCQASNAIK
ncbi:hypothetical protein, partial [Cedecea sp.]|uniref:hypothetical protein n=1 Tax=Cedecea sp. TaxID=1970739 RepID=UPI002F41473B